MAEEGGLILTLGSWVLVEACRQGAYWNKGRQGIPLTVTINLSGKQLLHDGLMDEISVALRASELPPEYLILEITETVLMHETETTLRRLGELKALGVRLAIDDFGTGYSSLSYLQQFPVDVLKIDQSFIEGLLRGTSDSALVSAIIALAGSLSLRTIAEGVEDPGQREKLRTLGCDAAQGFLFSRPVPAEDVDVLLSSGPNETRPEALISQ